MWCRKPTSSRTTLWPGVTPTTSSPMVMASQLPGCDLGSDPMGPTDGTTTLGPPCKQPQAPASCFVLLWFCQASLGVCRLAELAQAALCSCLSSPHVSYLVLTAASEALLYWRVASVHFVPQWPTATELGVSLLCAYSFLYVTVCTAVPLSFA